MNFEPNLVLVKGYVKLIRPLAFVLMGFATFIGQTIALKSIPETSVLLFPVLASSLVTASSFVINDYFDVEIDRINKPEKPLPSGIISRKSALYLGIALFLAGFLASLTTNFIATSLLLGTYGLSVLYNIYGKRTGLLGNIIVSFCVSTAFVYGSITAINSIDIIVLYISLLSFFKNLGREIVQSIQDMDGDKLAGVRSVALVYGPRFAAVLGSITCAITLILAPIIFLYQFRNVSFLFLVVLIPEIGFLFSSYLLLRRPTKESASRFVKQVNLWTVLILMALMLIISS